MKRFFSQNIQGDFIYLDNEEAQHCIKVLRGKVNDKVEVLNGNGILYVGTISSIQKHEVQIQTDQILKQETKNPNKLSIAICPTKNPARLEWFLEKATEIGIDQIYPIISDRTEKQNIKQERLQHIIVSAAKQSGQLFFPFLHQIQTLKELYNSPNLQFDNYYIAHCEDEISANKNNNIDILSAQLNNNIENSDKKQHLKNVYAKNETALLLIGPEGDFTKTEVQYAINKNYTPVSLGNSILRVETAGVYACSVVQMINE